MTSKKGLKPNSVSRPWMPQNTGIQGRVQKGGMGGTSPPPKI